MDVTPNIERHLMSASRLVVAARGNKPGKYVIIVQVVVGDADSNLNFWLNWDSYESDTQ